MALSIITAIHNALPMNRFYWEMLSAHTLTPFELIVIDNHSTDGSESFFAGLAADGKPVVHVRNATNRGYSESQLQGMQLARFGTLCFLNNDIWVPRGWHRPFEKALSENPYLILSPSGEDAQPSLSGAARLKRRWRRCSRRSRAWQILTGLPEYERLKLALRWMYGDLEVFRSPTPFVAPGYFHGIKGDSVIFHRRLLERIAEPWDRRIQAADWHLYLLAARLHEEDPSFPLPRVLLDSYVHHFGRYSARRKPEAIEAPGQSLSIDDFWGTDTVRRLWWGYHHQQ